MKTINNKKIFSLVLAFLCMWLFVSVNNVLAQNVDLQISKTATILYPTTTTQTIYSTTTVQTISNTETQNNQSINGQNVITLSAGAPSQNSNDLLWQILNPSGSEKITTAVNSLVVMPLTVLALNPLGISGALARINSGLDLWLLVQRSFYGLLSILGLRRKPKTWGTVYDTVSKQPLDPAIVTLYDAISNKKIEQSISDLAGRFGFFAPPGRYVLSSVKTHYDFPSKNIAGPTDLVFENLYHGEMITINSEHDIVNPNIPMDPLAFDWNQQDKLRLIKIHPKREYAVYLLCRLIFFVSFLFSILGFMRDPGTVTGIFLGVSTLIAIANFAPGTERLWGRLINKETHLPITEHFLQLSPINLPTVTLAHTLSGADGRFFLRANPGNYNISVLNKEKQSILSGQISVGKNGAVNSDISI